MVVTVRKVCVCFSHGQKAHEHTLPPRPNPQNLHQRLGSYCLSVEHIHCVEVVSVQLMEVRLLKSVLLAHHLPITEVPEPPGLGLAWVAGATGCD